MSSRFCLSESILLETDDLLAVNKPAGLLAVPDRWDKTKPNLFSLLQAARPGPYLANVHRLDRNTTGVFLLVKNREAFRALVRQFRERQTRKVYRALVHGDATECTIDLPIGSDHRRPGYSRIDQKHGKPARSTVHVSESFYGYALLEVEIETGRLHQVRVHLQAVGHPLVGDADYGGAPLLLSQLKHRYKAKEDEEERPLLARPALHAGSVTLREPPVTITAPLPKDFGVALKYLRKFAAR